MRARARGQLDRQDWVGGPLLRRLAPDRGTARLLSLQHKDYRAVCLELKPQPTKVRSFCEAMPAARPETRGEVTWSQGSFAVPGSRDLSQVLGETLRERETSSLLSQNFTLAVT